MLKQFVTEHILTQCLLLCSTLQMDTPKDQVPDSLVQRGHSIHHLWGTHCSLNPPPPVVLVGLCRWPLGWWWGHHLCSRSESLETPQSPPPPLFHWSLKDKNSYRLNKIAASQIIRMQMFIIILQSEYLTSTKQLLVFRKLFKFW